MKTHPFAEFIYSVEDTLGLWHEARKTEQTSKRPFDAHREHFQNKTDKDDLLPRLEEICELLHIGCNLSPDMISNHVDVLESVYIALARREYILKESAEDTIKLYIKNALIPLMCVDISIFKQQASEMSIYYHLDKILRLENVMIQDNGQRRFGREAAKQYMHNYIQNYFDIHKDILIKYNLKGDKSLINDLLKYLYYLTGSKNQTCTKLNQIIKICNHKFSAAKVDNSVFSIRPIAAAYTAIIILQDIDNKTGMFGHFYNIYRKLTLGNEKLNLLAQHICTLLDLKNEKAHIKAARLGMPAAIISLHLDDLNERKTLYLDGIVEIIISFFETPAVYRFDNDNKLLYQLEYQIIYLSNMVSLPPIANHLNYSSNILDYQEIKAEDHYQRVVEFNKNNVTKIITLTKQVANRYQKYLSQYIVLIDALDCIKNEDPAMALDIIDSVDRENLSTFGFIKHALAVLKIGLMYNLKWKAIKNGSLMQQVNDIINHQGIVFVPTRASQHVIGNSNDSWLSKDEYIKHSIISGGNTYNTIIAQAIYAYNYTIARHTTSHVQEKVAHSRQTSINNGLNLNHFSEFINHGLLDKLNEISGKILTGLDKINTDVEHTSFVEELIEAGFVLSDDLSKNLIHCITGSSLGVCLLDHSAIMMFLSAPGDDVENIIELGKKTKVVQSLFRYHHP
ncbi:hypothetical protein ACEUBB_11775 [Aeromonas rivipollensis]|uniref:Uncharacterized protein n=1 Tax=Aeromonas salmonicida TaxID=645 RepID=A0AAX3VWR6_AERSA|nr:hypothetical protein [Aeromonas salmonicida]WHF38135.1 hypothetical protein QLQ87_07265 [Aeromonas salmonicida]